MTPTSEWERLRRERVSPDCRDGKHRACVGDAWDVEADTPADCECDCHHITGSPSGGPEPLEGT